MLEPTPQDVADLFAAFDGASALARAIEVPISTAHDWLQKGRIPRSRLYAIRAAAREKGVEIPTVFHPAAPSAHQAA